MSNFRTGFEPPFQTFRAFGYQTQLNYAKPIPRWIVGALQDSGAVHLYFARSNIALRCYAFRSLIFTKVFTTDGTDGTEEELFVFIRVIREIRG